MMSELFPNIGWRDVIDIAAVAFIIYRTLLFLKGRVATRLILALSVVVLLFFLSGFAGLDTLHWILKAVLGSLILILVIIFQSDLRRAFVTLGRRRRTVGHDAEEASEVIDELVSAMTDLSSRRIGALIVFEREMSLKHFMEMGTEIDAKVTSEILNSIFLPYSPIHDGAVIIQKGKLTRAGCFLPLSQNPNISKTLGTRHRAAIGLTEMTDAVALVVSEETGIMSVVVDGKRTPVTEAGMLRKLIRRHLEPEWLA